MARAAYSLSRSIRLPAALNRASETARIMPILAKFPKAPRLAASKKLLFVPAHGIDLEGHLSEVPALLFEQVAKPKNAKQSPTHVE
jgi:hypothetical protein